MPIDDLVRDLLPHAPAMAVIAAVTALPLAATVLLAPPRRRTAPALLAGTGLLLGSIALVGTPGLRGPILHDPAVLAAQRLAHTAAGSAYIAGSLCLLAAVVLILLRPRSGRPRVVLGSASGLLIGLGAPFAVRISLGRPLVLQEFHGGVFVPVIIGLLVVAFLFALLVCAGSRAVAAAIGIGAGAVPAAALTATSSGMQLLAIHTGAQLFLIPAGLVLVASVCVGALGVVVWKAAGTYWPGPETVNPAGENRASPSRSS